MSVFLFFGPIHLHLVLLTPFSPEGGQSLCMGCEGGCCVSVFEFLLDADFPFLVNRNLRKANPSLAVWLAVA